jgi:hypothetical protein
MTKIFKPKFSKKEYAIIKECCSQVVKSMEQHDINHGLDDLGKLIKEDIYTILKKID